MLPLTSAQAGVWMAVQRQPDTTAFDLVCYVDIRGPLDASKLVSCIGATVAEAGCLHARFVLDGDEPRQFQGPAYPGPVPIVEVGGEKEAREWIDRERQTRLRVDGPLFAFALLRLGPRRWWFYQRYHHLVMDASGIVLFSERAAAHYRGDAGEVDWSLQRLVEAEGGYRASAKHDKDRAFWLERLRDPAEPAQLIGRGDGPARQPLRHTVFLPAHGHRTALAAIAAYTHRMTGQTDIVLAFPVTGRGGVLKHLPGMVANVVPLRLTVRPEHSTADLLATIGRAYREPALHGRFSGFDLTRELRLQGGLAAVAGPAVNVMPMNHHLHLGEGLGGPAEVLSHGPVSDLSLVIKQEERLRLDFDADSALCTPRELAGHAERFTRLIEAMAADPQAAIGTFDLADTAAMLSLGTDEKPVAELTWPQAFEAQVRATPEALALICEDERLSYQELNERANRLAHSLIADGVRPGDVIGIAMPRGCAMIVAMLGVLKTGAAYLPLDLDVPADRLDYMVADSGAKLVLRDAEAESYWSASDPQLAELPLDQPAYVIYTSGSTGRPKGVVVPHDGITSLVLTAVARLGVTAQSRVAQFASIGFDVAVFDTCMALCTGATLVIVPSPRRVADDSLCSYLTGHGVTHMILPPSLVAALPAECELPEGGVLVVGTETVPTELIARWGKRMRVVVAYGLTEATVNSTFWPAEDGWTGPVPIGVPDPNTCAYVLDSALRPAGVGVVGELYIGGRGLALGYHGRPGLTAQRFLPDPFGPPGSRLYRTGDKARWRPDGNLDFLGRSDNQIKLRGYRVEPAEIESVLMAHPELAQAAIVLDKSKRLVAYVVPTAGEVDPAEIKRYAAHALPPYMVPAIVVALPGPLPLTPNGKLDRAALPAPSWEQLAGDAAPTTQAETQLAAIFAELLELPRVGVTETFFTLGGDSISAVALVNRARRAGLHFTVRDVFDHGSVSALAAIASSAVAPAVHRPDPGPLTLTPTMRRWLADGGIADGFWQSVTLPLPGVTRPELESALQRLIDHHDTLRTRLTPGAGQPSAEVFPAAVGSAASGERERAAHHLAGAGQVSAEVLAPGAVRAWVTGMGEPELDPARGRMVHAMLGDGELRLVVHHLAVDAASWHILLGDLAVALRDEPLAPVPVSFRAWAAAADEVDASDELPYWREQVEAARHEIGRGLDGEVDVEASTRTVTVTVPEQTSEALLATMPGLIGASVPELLLTALAQAWGGPLLAEVESHGRQGQADLSRTVGWFTSIHPVLIDTASVKGWRAARRVREQLSRVPGEGLGYGLLRDRLPRARAGVLFNYLGKLPEQISRFGAGKHPRTPVTHPLEVNVVVRDGCLRADLKWAAEAVAEAEVTALASRWLERLDELAGRGRYPEDALPLTPLQEGLYFHAALEAGGYLVQQTIALQGQADGEAMRRALQTVVDRHAPLRACFRQLGDGQLVQLIAPAAEVAWREETAHDPAQTAASEREKPFDLGHAPLIRGAFVHGDGHGWLILTLHHIIADGWSVPIMVREILTAYSPDATLPEVASYRDYLGWLGRRDRRAAVGAWARVLEGIQPTIVAPSGANSAPGEIVVQLSAVDSAAVTARAREHGLTLSTVVQGIWGAVLGAVTGRTDVVFGTTVCRARRIASPSACPCNAMVCCTR